MDCVSYTPMTGSETVISSKRWSFSTPPKFWLSLVVILGVLSLAPLVQRIRYRLPLKKRAEISRLMQLADVYGAVRRGKSQLMAEFRAEHPQCPEEFFKRYEQKWDLNRWYEFYAEVYDRHLSLEDLRALNAFYTNGATQREAFYSTEAGQRILKVVPIMKREGAEFGRLEFRRIAAEIYIETHGTLTEQSVRL